MCTEFHFYFSYDFAYKEEVMRIGLLIRDLEYRDALIEMISEFDKEIFVEIAGPHGTCRNCVILTDVRPEEIGSDALLRLRDRTVFISCAPENTVPSKDQNALNTIHRVFKYSRISRIMSELSMVYSRWTGDAGSSSILSRSIVVCSATGSGCSDRCLSLARQIVYRRGGSILVLSLGYINNYGHGDGSDHNYFARLMYMLEAERDFPPEAFTTSDSYGISYLMMPAGRNPVAYLDGDDLAMLIRSLAAKFDTLIMDAGTAYRNENLRIMRDADNVLCFSSARQLIDVEPMLGEDHRSRYTEIDISGDDDENLRIDDYVREVYGVEVEEDEKSGYGTKVR